MKISQRVSELLSGHDFSTKVFKGYVKKVDEIILLILSELPGRASYLYQSP